MTLSKLAQLANVSVSVVSKAFSGKDGVSDAMREHVFSVAREQGCFEQFYHAPYDKPVVAVIIPEAISVYYIHYIEVLKRSMEDNGYTMLLSISNFDPEMTRELVRYYTEHGKVNGIVLFGEAPKLKSGTETAIITLNDCSTDGFSATVRFDLERGLYDALSHLYSLGHRRIAYIGEPLTRMKGLIMKSVMKKVGFDIPSELMIESLSRFENAGKDGVRRLLSLENRPTAILGAYGYITRGIINELLEQGLSIPDDVSVISMDNDPSELHPSLDVACIPSGIEACCDGIMEALNRSLHSPGTQRNVTIEIPSEFHVGHTVSAATQ